MTDVSNGSNFGQTEMNFQINENELYILYIVKPAIIVENCAKTELVTSTVKHVIDVSISWDHFLPESSNIESLIHMINQGGKFVGCAEDFQRRKFENLLHFGVKLQKTVSEWHIGAQNFASDFGVQDKDTSLKISVNNNTIITCLNYLHCFGLWPCPYLPDFLKISSAFIHQVLSDRIWQAIAIAGPHIDILDF